METNQYNSEVNQIRGVDKGLFFESKMNQSVVCQILLAECDVKLQYMKEPYLKGRLVSAPCRMFSMKMSAHKE